MRRIAHYFRLNGDMTKFREFTRKTGDYYLQAANGLRNSGNLLKASLLFVKAADCYREIEDHVSARDCGLAARKYCAIASEEGRAGLQGSALDLKRLGDYFRSEDDTEAARECYEMAATEALEEGKLMLAGGLFRDSGDCSSRLNDVERAVNNHTMAADNYLKSEQYFEAAWSYNVSGFLLISLKRFNEAAQMAGKAKRACNRGHAYPLVWSLSRICGLLSRENYLTAHGEWQKIRRKFKRSYINLVDSCFHHQ